MQIEAQHRVALFERTAIVLDIIRGRYLLYDTAIAHELGQVFFELGSTPSPVVLDPLIEDGVLVNDDKREASGQIFDYRKMRFHQFSSEAWSSRTLNGRSATRTELRLLTRLTWHAAVLQVQGFTALQKLNEPDLDGSSTVGEEKLHALRIPERYLKASLWSPLKIACLQMSFAIAAEFRREGVDAQLVIGVRPLPFVAHAWVEINGTVWGDEPDLQAVYGELYRIPERPRT
ncbi:lasso peptide biosynthesis B2 protein [Ensifer sp. ENS06]|uniref:lasso peptide biosynthesis B2 protein n=1 Tax=Ensifer sp. ENS06 TaxID=2769276 RepID=UPI001781449A|nr:lasso peptide biosynthesis B2 protein [Ensifer sp. ENS06]MBD9627006.1 lasso peptide biosynthesis B2 protein [Ensifer sp. ENS06]